MGIKKSSISDLIQKIENKNAKIAVIGLGYVGLPVACLFADEGFSVTGVDILSDRIHAINAGISPIEGKEPGLEDLLKLVIQSGKLNATLDYNDLRIADVVLIDVETPVDDHHVPRYEALKSVLINLGPVLKPGALVIVESTISPGTMLSVVLPFLEEHSGMTGNEDFFLGNCPERVMPGKLLHNLRTLSRVCGGGTPETADAMVSLYRFIVSGDLDPVDWITAELVKTVENAYRDVQIAFANEVAMICEALGGDVWKVRELVNKSPYRQMHLPGAGVGGHCIPKDPWLLVHSVQNLDVPVRLIPSARAVNDGMPAHIVKLLLDAFSEIQLKIQGTQILILGYAYLEESDDSRNSPSQALINILMELGAKVKIHDPYISRFKGDIYEFADNSDAVVLMVSHKEYREVDLQKLLTFLNNKIYIDAKGIGLKLASDEAIFRTVGKGSY